MSVINACGPPSTRLKVAGILFFCVRRNVMGAAKRPDWDGVNVDKPAPSSSTSESWFTRGEASHDARKLPKYSSSGLTTEASMADQATSSEGTAQRLQGHTAQECESLVITARDREIIHGARGCVTGTRTRVSS